MKGGKSLQRLASLIDIDFVLLHSLVHDGKASDQTIGRVVAWLDHTRSSDFKRILELVQNYRGLPRQLYKMEEALWLEIVNGYKRGARHPIHWQKYPYEYRKSMCLVRDLWAKKMLLSRVEHRMPIKGVWFNDGHHYFQWKVELNRALNPSATREQWLSSIPDSTVPLTPRSMRPWSR